MPSRLSQYRVRTHTPLTPELWNWIFGDVDSRVASLESERTALQGAIDTVETVAIDRINSVVNPALGVIYAMIDKGFMHANSLTSRTLVLGDTITFTVDDLDQRALFEPTAFTSLTHTSNGSAYAIARTVDWNKENGTYWGEIISFVGSPGPWNDWIIGATAAFVPAQEAALDTITTASVQVHNDALATAADRATVVAALAGLAGGAVVTVNGQGGIVVLTAADVGAIPSANPTVANVAGTDNSTKIANTAFAQARKSEAIATAQQWATDADAATLTAAQNAVASGQAASRSYADSAVATETTNRQAADATEVTNRQAADALKSNIVRTTRDISGASATLALADSGNVVSSSGGSATVFTVPTNAAVAFPVGAQVDFLQLGTGQLSILPAGGVTLNSDTSKRRIAARYGGASLLKTATDTWVLFGSLTA